VIQVKCQPVDGPFRRTVSGSSAIRAIRAHLPERMGTLAGSPGRSRPGGEAALDERAARTVPPRVASGAAVQ
jgi:hypothetical protein